MTPDKPFQLTALERQSSAWLHLQAHLDSLLAVSRERLEGDLDEKRSTQQRARITLLKELLALGKPEPNAADHDA